MLAAAPDSVYSVDRPHIDLINYFHKLDFQTKYDFLLVLSLRRLPGFEDFEYLNVSFGKSKKMPKFQTLSGI